jgi:hypothetical protein
MVITMFVLAFLNFLILLIKSKEAKKKLIKVSWIRLSISIFCFLIAALSLFFLFLASSSEDLDYLSKNACTDDAIMNDSFIVMHDYFENLLRNNMITATVLLLFFGA